MAHALKVLIAGLGQMGKSHALAHHHHGQSRIVALVNRSPADLPGPLQGYPLFDDFTKALEATRPELVVISTYTDSHADYAVESMAAGAHVFVEKPLATNLGDAERVVEAAAKFGKKLVVGYILRHPPSWQRLIQEARALGGPYVFRLNLNQQSSGEAWQIHKNLMATTSPLVDCGGHYVDVMCQITDARPLRVHAISLRLSDEIDAGQFNYGQLQVTFEDGSVGWYEAGWGPIMSETAYFVKDVISPEGSVSIVSDKDAPASADIDRHTQVGRLLAHHSNGEDATIALADEPGHQELCDAEQAFMLRAIAEDVGSIPPAKRGIAMVFQTYALYPHLTVRDNMALGLKQAGAPKALIEERLKEATRMLALEPYLQRRPAELSGGQRQRVAIGRAVVREPTLFLFDEPLSNLDAALRMATRIEIASLHRNLKAAMIYVTHDQIEAMTLADKIVVLHDGVVEQIGPPMELYNNPANRFVAGFLGSPAMNFIKARAGGADIWGIRPEHIHIAGAEDNGTRLQGSITHIERLGADTNLLVQIDNDETVTVRLFGQYGFNVGETVSLTFEDTAIHNFDSSGQRI